MPPERRSRNLSYLVSNSGLANHFLSRWILFSCLLVFEKSRRCPYTYNVFFQDVVFNDIKSPELIFDIPAAPTTVPSSSLSKILHGPVGCSAPFPFLDTKTHLGGILHDKLCCPLEFQTEGVL